MGDQSIPAAIHVITRARQYQVIPMIAEFLARNAERKPLIILDTLGKAKPPRRAGDDSYQVDYAFGTQLKDAIDAVPGPRC